MRLVYAPYGIELNLVENQVCTLVVEHPRVLCEILQNLIGQINGEPGELILSETDTILPFAKSCTLIDNPLVVHCNEKKILTKLYKELTENANSMMYEAYSRINSDMVCFLEELLHTVPYHLDMELELDPATILKAYDVKIVENREEPLEMLIDYLRAVSTICGTRVVWLLNLKQFFSKEQMQQLYEFCFYEKIYVINLEGQKNYLLEHEAGVIVDTDLCFIELSSN